jgi:mannose-1-phosphate guanylyltransferase
VTSALLLAAGKSTRIATETGGGPKPLLELAGQTVLEHNLAWLAQAGIREVAINLHHQPEAIRNRMAESQNWGLKVRYLEEPELLGTAGALRNLNPTNTTLVVYGDNLTRFDLADFARFHRDQGGDLSLAIYDQATCPHTGIAGGRVEVNAHGRVTAFVEGGQEGLVNAGVYLVEPSVLAEIPAGEAYDFARQLFPRRLQQNRPLFGYRLQGFCLGLDTPASLERARELLNSGAVQL